MKSNRYIGCQNNIIIYNYKEISNGKNESARCRYINEQDSFVSNGDLHNIDKIENT